MEGNRGGCRFATEREYCVNQGSPVLGCGSQEDQAEVARTSGRQAGNLPLRSVGRGGRKAHFVIDCRCSFCHAQTTPSGKKAHETAARPVKMLSAGLIACI
jgi:hypothetical protein